MPELPEVETVARGLRARLPRRHLEAIELLRASIFSGDDLAPIEGAVVSRIERAGKYLIVVLTGGASEWQLLFHLGMTGQLLLHPAGHARAAHTHAVFHFGPRQGRSNESSLELHFRDPRRFGRIALAASPATGPGSGSLPALAPELGVPAGAEPLEISPTDFVLLFYRRAAPIKNALLNQCLLRGLGNIYADESLYRAGIAPRAHHLSRPRLLRLHAAVIDVLQEAIAAGGSSISDYLDSSGQPGWFHLQHRVYARTGEPCLRCHTPIRRIVLAGRSAHFCPRCQKQ